MKPKPQTIKEVVKNSQIKNGFYDFQVKTPQEYINALYKEYDDVFYTHNYHIEKGIESDVLKGKLAWLKTEIDNMKVEIAEDYIYTPKGKIKVKSIEDILYYEKLYGKKIYEEKAVYE